MNEVKQPRRPMLVFYIVMLILMLVFNTLVLPSLAKQQIQEVDYGTFMTMTEKKQIGEVEVRSNMILFTDKADPPQIYRTGIMDDPGLVQRLHESGAEFTSQIVEQASPFTSFLLTWILPIFIFIFLGQYLSRKMMDKAGGPGSMMFNLGKSNAKIANILEYGRHGQPAKPFLKPAKTASKSACIEAMRQKFDEEVQKL